MTAQKDFSSTFICTYCNVFVWKLSLEHHYTRSYGYLNEKSDEWQNTYLSWNGFHSRTDSYSRLINGSFLVTSTFKVCVHNKDKVSIVTRVFGLDSLSSAQQELQNSLQKVHTPGLVFIENWGLFSHGKNARCDKLIANVCRIMRVTSFIVWHF